MKTKNKKSKVENKISFLDKIFLLTYRKDLFIIILWSLVIILHNVIYSTLNINEKTLFTIATLIIPCYFVIAIVYTIIKYSFRKIKS